MRLFSSIRGILTLTIGALTLLIAMLAGAAIYQNWQRLEELRALKGATIVSDELFGATEKLHVVHDLSLSMLRSNDRETIDSLRPRLEEARTAADAALRNSLSALDDYDFAELAQRRKNSAARLEKVSALRAGLDRELRLPKELRSLELKRNWSTELTALINETQVLGDGFVTHFMDIDPQATLHLRFKYFLRHIIETSGHERSIIGQLIADNAAPTTLQVSELLRGRGETELSWRVARVLAEQSGIFAAIAPAYNDAASQQTTMYEMIQDVFYTPGTKRDAPYPISVEMWFELSTQTSDSFVALRDVATRATRVFAQNLIDKAWQQIAVQAVVFLVALLLCGYSFWIVVQRVVRPIERMIDALMRATRGEPVVLAASGRSDEISKLEGVLHAFQETAQEVIRSSAELERSRSELRAVVDHAVDGLITIDGKGDIRAFNPACEKLFGFTAQEVLGKNISILMPEPHRAAGEDFLSGFAGRELSAKRKDGSVFPIDLSISAFALEGSQHFSGIVRDITARKEVETALLRYTHALERSNKELDDFAYIASHDLKEPLRGIHNHARFLLEDNAEKLDQDSTGRLNRLVYLSQRMERLVNDLLYFSRIGRQELAIQSTDLSAVIADVESTLEQFLQERGAKIVMPTSLPTIVCDKPRVTELFRNLITNAVKYNDKTDKIIEIGFVPVQRASKGVLKRNVLYVRDNGRGIDREFHNEIFRIFKRLQSNKDTDEGTGVGLTFVKKIVERHGGQIWVESELGKGATFFFTLEESHHEHDVDAQAAA